jgi:hypothetical protein
MKRCPECNFVYLDTDEVCDLDGTSLVHADDAEFDGEAGSDRETRAAQAPGIAAQTPGGRRKTLAAVAVGGLVLGVVVFIVYYGTTQKSRRAAQTQEQSSQEPLHGPALAPQQTPSLTPSPPPPAASPSLAAASSTTARSTPSPRPASTRGAAVSSNPVSTGANESAKTGRVVIQLTNGARVEADEAWRTKEGVWYRRNGIVTLIKANRVKAIEKAPPK